jgi:hypothetical protein
VDKFLTIEESDQNFVLPFFTHTKNIYLHTSFDKKNLLGNSLGDFFSHKIKILAFWAIFWLND